MGAAWPCRLGGSAVLSQQGSGWAGAQPPWGLCATLACPCLQRVVLVVILKAERQRDEKCINVSMKY